MGQTRSERRARWRGKGGNNRPVFTWLENFNFCFTLTDQAQGNGLHAPCTARTGKLAPQNRRQRKAHQIIKRAAGQISLNQREIEITRMGHRRLDGAFGNFVKGNALYLNPFQGLFFFQNRPDMPRNGFTFAVRVSGQIEMLGAF